MDKGREPNGMRNVIMCTALNHSKKKDILSDVLYLLWNQQSLCAQFCLDNIQ